MWEERGQGCTWLDVGAADMMGRRAAGHVVAETGFGICNVREYSHGSLKSGTRVQEGSEGVGMPAPCQGVDREGGQAHKVEEDDGGAWREEKEPEKGDSEVESERAVLGKPKEETVSRVGPPANIHCSLADSGAPELFLTGDLSNGILNDKQFFFF